MVSTRICLGAPHRCSPLAATFASNPHIVLPSRSDLYPPVPLHPRPPRQVFSVSPLPRSMPVPPADVPLRDPFAPSSLNGAFSTSLKGTRALLRRRGRRVECLVDVVEREIRGWLGGPSWTLADDAKPESWRVIDASLIDTDTSETGHLTSLPSTPDRRMPLQHQIKTNIPPLPHHAANKCPAILELSRSPAHLSWAVADPFERLVMHILMRYYELISWSRSAYSLGLVCSIRNR